MAKKPALRRPSVLLLHEKHETLVLDALTEDALFRSALSVLRGRLKAGYWYYDEEFIAEANKVISRKDGKKAWDMLQDRRDHEYEGFTLEPLISKYPYFEDGDADDNS